jgi:hypothetical protein
MSDQIDYRALRERVDVGVKRQKLIAKSVLFVVSLVIYIAFMLIAWGTFLSNGGVPPQWSDFTNIPGVERTADPFTGAMVMLSIGWFTALLMQFIGLIFDTRLGERQIRSQVMGHELSRELDRLGMDELKEKPKRMMQLSEDGELEEIIETDVQERNGLDDRRAAQSRK